MDEGGGLENRYMGNCIVGSNPTPSASFMHKIRPLKSLRGLRFQGDAHGLSTNFFAGLSTRWFRCQIVAFLSGPVFT